MRTLCVAGVVRGVLLMGVLLLLTAGQTPPPYRDASLAPQVRAADLVARMTLDEMIGQMTLAEVNSLRPDDLRAPRFVGAVLSGGGGFPSPNTPEAWATRVNALQRQAVEETRLGIPILYGVDAIHGHNNVYGAVLYPHNIGLGAARNAELVRRIGQATACDVAATGIRWNYAPVLAVPQDVRWGRTYEAYGADPALVGMLGTALIEGLQGRVLDAPASVLATAKHYIADGGTVWGTSTTDDYAIDQGDATLTDEQLRTTHLPPYQDALAVEGGLHSVMVSFSSVNGLKMHAHQRLLSDVLRAELGFDGFVVSDWGGIDQIAPDDYDASVVAAVNAGVDMNMVPYDAVRFHSTLRRAVAGGRVTQARVQEGVTRILTVKFALGLFEQPYADASLLGAFSPPEARGLARVAVQQSLVLLTHDGASLPLPTGGTVLLAGRAADDIGLQAGGWSITWQGGAGAITLGTTIRKALQEAVSNGGGRLLFNPQGRFASALGGAGNIIPADVAVVVLAEPPYAEGRGDRADLTLPPADLALLRRVREYADRVVLVLLTGRPLVLGQALDLADAVMVAWLPGTEGAGVVDGLVGRAPIGGLLPHAWPASMAYFQGGRVGQEPPLFPLGHGLTMGDPAQATPLPEVACAVPG